MNRQRILANLLILGSGQIATLVVSGAYSIIVSRYLGPDRLGELSFALAVATVLGLLVGLGMETLIVRTVARDPEGAAPVVNAALAARSILMVPIPIVVYVYVRAAHLGTETSAAIYILTVSMILMLLSSVFRAMFRGREQMSHASLVLLAQTVIMIVLAVPVISVHGGVLAFAGIAVAASAFALSINLHLARKVMHVTWWVSWIDMRSVVISSLVFWANDVFLSVYMYIDSIVLGSIGGIQAVGFYAPATRVFSIALLVPAIIGPATMPSLWRLGSAAGPDFARVGRKTLSLLIASGIPLTIGLATFAGPVVFTIFGPRFEPSVPVLTVLSLSILPLFFNMQCGLTLFALNQQLRWTGVIAVMCLVNPLANIVLIPVAQHQWHNAALGAALALLVTELLQAAYGLTLLRRTLLGSVLGRTAAGSLAAGVGQLAVLWLTVAAWPVVSEMLGIAAYAALAITFGAVPKDDVRLLYTTLLGSTLKAARRGSSL